MLGTFWKLTDFFDRHLKVRAARLCMLLVLNGFAEMLSIGLLLPFLSLALGGEANSTAERALRAATESLGLSSSNGMAVAMAVGVGVVFLARNLFLAFVQWYLYRFIWTSRSDVTCEFHRDYLELPYSFHLQRKTSTIVRNLTMSLQEVFTGILMPLVLLASELIIVLTIGALMLVVNPMVTIGAAAGLTVIVALIHMFTSNRMKVWGATGTRTNQQMIQAATQALHSIKEIKVMGREGYFEDRFRQIMATNSQAKQWNNTASQLPRLILETVALWGGLAAVGVAVASGRPLAESLPVIAMFAVAALRLIPSFSRINQHLNNLRFNQSALDDLHADLMVFRREAAAQAPHRKAVVPLALNERISFENVTFRYPDAPADTVKEVSFTVERGQCVAFVGPTGSGKSTVMNLLLGLLQPSNGTITVDGMPVFGQIRRWQSLLAFIPQDVVVLEGSLRDNIAFGRDGHDEDRLNQAAAMAQLSPVLARLPQGMDSPVGERGLQFSGGERQRIGIARALYNDADVLVMDEATSSLDARTEADIAAAIHGLKGSKTVIIVAHRLSSVRNCDRLFYMENGRICASGSFDELARTHAGFADMVQKMSVGADAGEARSCSVP